MDAATTKKHPKPHAVHSFQAFQERIMTGCHHVFATDMCDPLPLAQDLIRCRSVTPDEAGAIAVLEKALHVLGFSCTRLPFQDTGTPDVVNLYAQRGQQRPTLCFAGHVDVVPPGSRDDWAFDPFAADVEDGILYGRGASDMKGAIAAFVAATARFIAEQGDCPGSIAFLITGDEEGPAINGTRKVLSWLAEQNISLDYCVVGEPTNSDVLGDTLKIGRRGSLSGKLVVHGTQGHVAYPQEADNPLPRLLRLLQALTATPLDQGAAHFDPSRLELTSINAPLIAGNVTPALAKATFNIRFNPCHTAVSLEKKVRDILASVGFDPGTYTLTVRCSGEAFITPENDFSRLVGRAIGDMTGHVPVYSTSGGTSDARFIKDVCPVVEFGLIRKTIHKVNESCTLKDLENLTRIYHRVLSQFFGQETG